jgi:T5orf172 domain
MSRKSQVAGAADSWPTILTLSINFQKKTFNPAFRTTLSKSQTYKMRCSCSRLPRTYPSNEINAMRSDLPQPTGTLNVRFIITSSQKIEQAKKLCILTPKSKHKDPAQFRNWMLRLTIRLSKLCERRGPDHRRDTQTIKLGPGFFPALKPFKSDAVDKISVSNEVRRKLNAPLSPSEIQGHGMGYVYILRSQSNFNTLGELKIGFSKHHPEHRAHELARCLSRPEIISHTPRIPHAKRLEAIIHAELVGCRKVQYCSQCRRNHREWFTVSHIDSREVVTRWSRWMLEEPYRDGKLIDEWKHYLAAKNFNSIKDNTSLAEFWMATIKEFPRDNSDNSEGKRFGAFLNACFWDDSPGSYGRDQTRNFRSFSDTLRDERIFAGDGRGLTVQELKDKVEEEADRLREGLYQNNKIENSDSSPITRRTRSTARLEEERAEVEEMLRMHEFVKHTKTGALSVSDPACGISESPLGDATLLPVLTLDELKYLDTPVTNWIGFTPTHTGFQSLQEAYQNGEWHGRKPEFKLPKASRKSQPRKVNIITTEQDHSPPATEQNASGGEQSTASSNRSTFIPPQTGGHPTFRVTHSPTRDTYTWTQPLTDEFKQQAKEVAELYKNGGSAYVEHMSRKSLQAYGYLHSDEVGKLTAGEFDDMFDENSAIDEAEHIRNAAQISPSPLRAAAKRKAGDDTMEMGIGSKKAKMWLDAL